MRELSSDAGSPADDLLAVGVLLLGLAAHALLARAYRPPDPLPSDVADERFSAGRAELVLERLLGPDPVPRPWGSAAARQMRERILDELRALGYEPSLWEAPTPADSPFVGRVSNVLARLEGSDTRMVLCVAHVDSAAVGAGVADDLAGVATLLETARAIRSWPAPRPTIGFLFSDGEEVDLLGARAFAAGHPWMEAVDVVLNVEGRGSSGPSLLFETGAADGWLVERFARHARSPFSSSLSGEVYRRLPNDTDFTPFREAGKSGLNFAFIEGVASYHTPLDTLERLDRGSLQHHGDNLEAALRGLWDAEREARPASGPPPGGRGGTGELVWFDVAGRWTFAWPREWCLPIALACLASLLLALARQHRARQVMAREVTAGALLAGAWIAGGAVGAHLLGGLGAGVLPWERTWSALVLACVSVLVLVGLAGACARGAHALLVPASLWCLGALAVAATLPGASFLFLPAAGTYAVLAHAPSGAQLWGLAPRLVGLLALLVSLPAWTPALLGLVAALGIGQVAVTCAASGLLATTIAPCFGAASPRLRRALVVLGLLCLPAALGARALGLRAGREARREGWPVNIEYELDAGTASARWLLWSDGPAPPASLRAALALSVQPADVERPWESRLGMPRAAPAPVLALEAPLLERVPTPEATGADGAQESELEVLRLRLRSPARAPLTVLALHGHERSADGLQGVKVIGAPQRIVGSGWLAFQELPEEGIEVELVRARGAEVGLSLYDRHPGLPTEAGFLEEARDAAGAVPIRFGDGTWVRRGQRLSE